jgi:hypothetical protein
MPIRGVVDAIKALFGVRKMYSAAVEDGEPGPWLEERVRATAPEFSVSSGFPMWKGERSPHEPPDGVIGRFFDVIEINAKRDLDARSAASSAFVKELKKLADAKVICRTSWV